jgi:CBS domain-containing protein
MKINEILKTKGSEVVTLSPESTVQDLVRLLVDKRIGAVVITSEDESVVGIVSERDVVHGLVRDPAILEHPVSAIMTGEVVTADPDQSVHDLAKLMTERRIRHVPVMDRDGLAGIISIGDVVKSRIDELEFERDQLESYVSGPVH